MIYCSNPKAQYISHKEEIDAAITKVLNDGRYILGREVESFESEFANYIGVSFGVGVGNGTEAIHLALKACNIGPHDEVITVSHTAVATVAAIELSGATPVFVDICLDNYLMDPSRIEEKVTSHTKAIIPVHIYGHPADMDPIMAIANKYNLIVIEDCAQAHGAEYKGKKVGSMGHLSCFSFYPTKNLGAIGDGGMVVTNSPSLNTRCKLLREYGWEERYISKIRGWNTRLDELQAAILRIKLKHLDHDNNLRKQIAGVYNNTITSKLITIPPGKGNADPVYHLYVIRLKERDELLSFLTENGISALIHYPVPVHLQPAYVSKYSLEVTERIAGEILSLPIYPELGMNEVSKIVETINSFKREIND